ncbi:MAG: ribose uptake protein RbsU [Acetilactobacillus jinshanensis]
MGTTYGALIVGILIFIIKQPLMTPSIFWWGFLGGVGWSIGQLTQYRSFINLGVSTTSPITAGVQLIGVNFIGVSFFGSWKSALAKTIGLVAIILIIFGVFLTTRTGKKQQSVTDKKTLIKYVLELIVGTGIGYTACSTLPRIPDVSGWSTFPAQTVGMIVSAVMIGLMFYCL